MFLVSTARVYNHTIFHTVANVCAWCSFFIHDLRQNCNMNWFIHEHVTYQYLGTHDQIYKNNQNNAKILFLYSTLTRARHDIHAVNSRDQDHDSSEGIERLLFFHLLPVTRPHTSGCGPQTALSCLTVYRGYSADAYGGAKTISFSSSLIFCLGSSNIYPVLRTILSTRFILLSDDRSYSSASS